MTKRLANKLNYEQMLPKARFGIAIDEYLISQKPFDVLAIVQSNFISFWNRYDEQNMNSKKFLQHSTYEIIFLNCKILYSDNV